MNFQREEIMNLFLKLWRKRIVQQIIWWLLAFCAFFLLFTSIEEKTIGLKMALVFIAPAPIPVYFHFYILEKFFKKRKYLIYIFLLVVLIGISSLIFKSVFRVFFPNPLLQISGFFTTIIYIIVTSALRFLGMNISQQYKIQEVEFKQVKTELNLLKSQINPHFFFNTLNSLYALSLEKSDKLPSTILKLSELMRYALESSKQKEVLLTNEIKFIENYIDLERIRLEENVNINFYINGNVGEKIIAPMLLITFVENAFKHGLSNAVGKGFLNINLKINDNFLKFVVANSREKIEDEFKPKGTKTGLENVRKRLEYIYPRKHKLNISETENEYCVSLIINL